MQANPRLHVVTPLHCPLLLTTRRHVIPNPRIPLLVGTRLHRHTFPFLIASLLGVIARPSLPQHSTSRLRPASSHFNPPQFVSRLLFRQFVFSHVASHLDCLALHPDAPHYSSPCRSTTRQIASRRQHTTVRPNATHHNTRLPVTAHRSLPIRFSSPLQRLTKQSITQLGVIPPLSPFTSFRFTSRLRATTSHFSPRHADSAHISPRRHRTPHHRRPTPRQINPRRQLISVLIHRTPDRSSASFHGAARRQPSTTQCSSPQPSTRLHFHALLHHTRRAIPARSFSASFLHALSLRLVRW